jgi:hypothetical protein
MKGREECKVGSVSVQRAVAGISRREQEEEVGSRG